MLLLAVWLLGAPRAAAEALYVVRRGWHVDVGFAAADLRPPLERLTTRFPGVRYLFFGFGDRRYLTSAHRGAPELLAALWPGNGLILATGLTATPAQAFGSAHVIRLEVTAEQLRAAQDFAWSSLDGTADASDAAAAPEPIDVAGPYPGSAYYAARPTYSALHTCNTWAAELLRSAGFPAHSRGVVFASQVWKQTRAFAAVAESRVPATDAR
jgi:hypothetical protein